MICAARADIKNYVEIKNNVCDRRPARVYKKRYTMAKGVKAQEDHARLREDK